MEYVTARPGMPMHPEGADPGRGERLGGGWRHADCVVFDGGISAAKPANAAPEGGRLVAL